MAAVGVLAAFCFAVLIGGTALGELDPLLRLLTALMAGTFILVYALKAPTRADRVDRGVLLSLLFFAGAAVMSQFPRQSFDALLGALALTAVLFFARGQLFRDEVRVAFIFVLIGVSAVVTFQTASRWLSETLEWWSLTGWTVLPPLELNFSAAPWGHRHDLALLNVMLYPSWWLGRPGPLRRAAGTVVGVLTVLIVIVDGSRMLWLALAVATLALLVPPLFRRLRSNGWFRIALVSGTLVAIGVLAVSGLGMAVVDRLLNVDSLGWRSAMWVSLYDAWLAHPIAGLGPGSFPWVLQLTDYFQTNSWAPRHPDSVFFQLIAEAGILGIAALATLVVTLLVPVLRGRSTAAAWALTTFAVAGIGSNPTDFAFLVVVAVGWVAFAVPRDDGGPRDPEPRWRPAQLALLAGLAIIASAYSMTIAAAFLYEDARQAVAREDLARARRGLDAAIALDPGLALYARQRGTLSYVEGNAPAGIRDLELAAQLNPSDDLAWRTLALAYTGVGNDDAAESALSRALSAQRSDPTNLLLSAYWDRLDGRKAEVISTLAEVVRAWPATLVAAGWEHVASESGMTAQVIDEAVARWTQGSPFPESSANQGIWLAAFRNRPDLLLVAADELGVTEALANASVAVFTCDSQSGTYLEQVAESDRRTQLYWQLRLRDAARTGSPDEVAIRIITIMSGGSFDPDTATETLNPLHQNGWVGFSADAWGYRRLPIAWPADNIQLPSPEAGAVRWLMDPVGAIRAAGLEERLPDCV